MPATLTAETFNKLLAFLDDDPEQAGQRYEDLRRTLLRFFEWRSAPFPEEQTDEVLNRVAHKLGQDLEIRNLGSYCLQVARLVRLEALKGNERRQQPLEDYDLASVDNAAEIAVREARLNCLDTCMDSLPPDNRELILAYYQDDEADRIEQRKHLADRLGIKREALANRAQRLRDKLEHCVKRCLRSAAGNRSI